MVTKRRNEADDRTNCFERRSWEVFTTMYGATDNSSTWEEKKADPLEDLKDDCLNKISKKNEGKFKK